MNSWQAWKNRLVVATLLGAAACAAQAETVVSIDASPNPAIVGSTVDLSVLIDGASDLYAYQFSLSFDPAVLRATAVTEGAFLGTGGATYGGYDVIDNGTGKVSFVFNTLLGPTAGVSGSGALAHIRFDVIGYGTTPLAFGDGIFLDSNLADVAVTYTAAPLAAVPEPGTWLMLGVGLAGLATLRRRTA